MVHSIVAMVWGTVELEPEIREWLTVFAKTRMREDREVERAKRALARCVAEAHTVEEA
jgi:hypothetical protein